MNVGAFDTHLQSGTQTIDVMCTTCWNYYTPYSKEEREGETCPICTEDKKIKSMEIHKKINTKGNAARLPWDMTAKPEYRERHAETIEGHRAYPRKIMKRNYMGCLDELNGERIFYPQDRKTNYREPREPDGEDFRGNEAQNFEAEQMAKIQRELK